MMKADELHLGHAHQASEADTFNKPDSSHSNFVSTRRNKYNSDKDKAKESDKRDRELRTERTQNDNSVSDQPNPARDFPYMGVPEIDDRPITQIRESMSPANRQYRQKAPIE